MEMLLLTFLCVVVVLIAAVLFCGWMLISIGRFLVGLVIPKRKPRAMQAGSQCCSNAQCECENPWTARFCRRCGKSLPNLMRIVASRAAML